MNRKLLIRGAGSSAVLVSLAFLSYRLWGQGLTVMDWRLGGGVWVAAALGSLVYGVACLCLSRAWYGLIRLFGALPIDRLTATWIYAKSQIGKYVPGNFLHLAGRHLLGRELGLSHGTLAMSAVAEIGGLLIAATAMAVSAMIFLGFREATYLGIGTATAVVIGAAVAVLALPHLWQMLRERYPALTETNPEALRRGFAQALGSYLLFFAAAGSVLVGLVAVQSGGLALREAAPLLLVFAMSWLAGFVTPGAPSGIGVREAVIVMALERMGHAHSALGLAFLFRLVTITGDLLFLGLVAWFARRRHTAQA